MQKLFYEPDKSNERLRELREAHPGSAIKKSDLVKESPRRTSVSLMVSKFARDLPDRVLARQLRQDSSEDSHKVNRRIIQESLEAQESSIQSREETAQKSIITNLQKQQYG